MGLAIRLGYYAWLGYLDTRILGYSTWLGYSDCANRPLGYIDPNWLLCLDPGLLNLATRLSYSDTRFGSWAGLLGWAGMDCRARGRGFPVGLAWAPRILGLDTRLETVIA